MIENLRAICRRVRRFSHHHLALLPSLSLGIAAVLFALTATENVLFQEDASTHREVVRLMAQNSEGGYRTGIGYGEAKALSSRVRCCREVTAFKFLESVLRGDRAAAQSASAIVVDGHFFDVVPGKVAVGRPFSRSQPWHDSSSIMLSWELAWRLFGQEDHAVGQTLIQDGERLEVIGVLPKRFRIPFFASARVDTVRLGRFGEDQPVSVLARVDDSFPRSEAIEELAQIDLRDGAGAEGAGQQRLVVIPASEAVDSRVMLFAQTLAWLAAILCAVAAVSSANFSVSRLARRRAEFALRWALGLGAKVGDHARRYAYILGIAVLSAAVGGVVAQGALVFVSARAPAQWENLSTWQVSLSSVAWAVVACGVLLFLVEALPELMRAVARRSEDLREGLSGRAGARGFEGVGRLLLLVVCAAACLLIAASLLMSETLATVTKRDWGFHAQGLSVAEIRLPSWRAEGAPERATFFEQEATRALAQAPGVMSFSYASSVPPATGVFVGAIHAGRAGQPAEVSAIGLSFTAPRYFEVMGQKMLAGRSFTDAEVRAREPVVVVSESLALRLFGDVSAAVGEWPHFDEERRQILGVVADIDTPGGAQTFAQLHAYWPLSTYRSQVSLVLRSEGEGVATALQALRSLDPDLVIDAAPIDALVREEMAETRLLSVMFRSMGSMAFALGVLSIYAIVSSLVASKTREISIRLAVGARTREVRGWLIRRVMPYAALGVLVGVAGSYPFCRLLSAYLFGMAPDRVGSRLIAGFTVLLACWFAARFASRRVLRASPAEVLKAT